MLKIIFTILIALIVPLHTASAVDDNHLHKNRNLEKYISEYDNYSATAYVVPLYISTLTALTPQSLRGSASYKIVMDEFEMTPMGDELFDALRHGVGSTLNKAHAVYDFRVGLEIKNHAGKQLSLYIAPQADVMLINGQLYSMTEEVKKWCAYQFSSTLYYDAGRILRPGKSAPSAR